MTEDEYWAKYDAELEHCVQNNIRCKCCNVIPQDCEYWQMIRLICNPSPSEAQYIDSRRKEIAK